jgi:hypothetical protein
MLLGKPWIEKDQARKQKAEKDLEQHKQELRDFLTRRIAQLIEERENRSRVNGPSYPLQVVCHNFSYLSCCAMPERHFFQFKS